ncbi:MAG: beta-lactamase family protein [Chitinophagaceae bacterium]|nr:beta-lactamase family protein [Chitinophagaceae bacterium]
MKPDRGDREARIEQSSDIFPPEVLKAYKDSIQAFYEKMLVRSGFNGSMLVVKNGVVLFEAYKGYANFKTKDTLTEHSAIHLASVSKTFTAMAVLKLVQEGKLNLDDSLQKFFPGFPYEGVTVKTLLNHRSGLPNYAYFMENLKWDQSKFCTNRDILNYMIEFKPDKYYNPDKRFNYCNTNYSLLALVIEEVSGMSYEDYLRKTIFLPLGMKDTFVYNPDRDTATAVPSYDQRGRLEATTWLDKGYGDKNVYSTPRDMFKWDQALTAGKVVNKELLEAAYTPYSNERRGIKNYGLGWRMNVYPNGRKIIFHNGWWHGNNTVFIRDIQDSLTIIVLGNKYNRNIYNAKKIAEIFEGGVSIEED